MHVHQRGEIRESDDIDNNYYFITLKSVLFTMHNVC